MRMMRDRLGRSIVHGECGCGCVGPGGDINTAQARQSQRGSSRLEKF